MYVMLSFKFRITINISMTNIYTYGCYHSSTVVYKKDGLTYFYDINVKQNKIFFMF